MWCKTALALLMGLCLVALSACAPARPSTTFHEAITKGDVEQVRANLFRGDKLVGIDVPIDKTGQHPLHRAAELGHTDLVAFLLRRGAQVNSLGDFSCRTDQLTPLHLAARNGHKETVAVLLQAGADVNPRNASGQTPADLARAAGHMDLLELLHLQAPQTRQGQPNKGS